MLFSLGFKPIILLFQPVHQSRTDFIMEITVVLFQKGGVVWSGMLLRLQARRGSSPLLRNGQRCSPMENHSLLEAPWGWHTVLWHLKENIVQSCIWNKRSSTVLGNRIKNFLRLFCLLIALDSPLHTHMHRETAMHACTHIQAGRLSRVRLLGATRVRRGLDFVLTARYECTL